MNAKTGSASREHPECVGRYGKGIVNSNGEHLIEFALANQLFLTNTKSKHKMCHRTTWAAPDKNNDTKDKDGSIRRNLYRNQIDYLIMKNRDLVFVQVQDPMEVSM